MAAAAPSLRVSGLEVVLGDRELLLRDQDCVFLDLEDVRAGGGPADVQGVGDLIDRRDPGSPAEAPVQRGKAQL